MHDYKGIPFGRNAGLQWHKVFAKFIFVEAATSIEHMHLQWMRRCCALRGRRAAQLRLTIEHGVIILELMQKKKWEKVKVVNFHMDISAKLSTLNDSGNKLFFLWLNIQFGFNRFTVIWRSLYTAFDRDTHWFNRVYWTILYSGIQQSIIGL